MPFKDTINIEKAEEKIFQVRETESKNHTSKLSSKLESLSVVLNP